MSVTEQLPAVVTAPPTVPRQRSGVDEINLTMEFPRLPGTPARRRRRWLPSAETSLVGGLILLVLTVHAVNITGYPMASDDEGTYLAQAWAIQQGLGLAHYTYWYDHPPLGWMQLALVSWLPAVFAPDTLAVAAARMAMLPVTAATLALVYVLGRRIGLPRWSAAVALLLVGLSPLAVTMLRQIYLDSFAVAWMLAAFVLAYSPRKHLWHHMAAGAAAAVSVLSKETMLLVVPALVYAVWRNTERGIRTYSFAGFLSGLALVGIIYPLYALLQGELFPGDDHVSLIGAWQFQLASRDGSGNIFTAGSNANGLLSSWLYYDAVLPIAGVAAVAVGLFVRRLRVISLAALLLILVSMRPGGYLPAMYVVQLLPFLALAIAGVAAVVVGALLRRPRPGGRRGWYHARPVTGARIGAVVAVVAVAAALVVPQWWDGNRRAWTADDNARYVAAADWFTDRVPAADRAETRVVLDDVLWLDLVNAGFERENVIWFYKLDLDPAVPATLPNGWQDIDYLVSSSVVRNDVAGLPTVTTLMEESTVVATFGEGEGRVEIRRINQGE